MNHLAHSFLAFEHDSLLVGTYLADLVSNKQMLVYSHNIRQGIMLHRRIDAFTDQHPLVRESTRLLHDTMHKYAPVVLDIYYDYLLSKHWATFSDLTLSVYCDQIYIRLANYKSIMTPPIKWRFERMVQDHWLERYQTYADLERAFGFLGRRAKFRSDFTNAPAVLANLEKPLEERFTIFFPEVISWVREQISEAIIDG
jgi:acyl carrier protein phosphodiesterase